MKKMKKTILRVSDLAKKGDDTLEGGMLVLNVSLLGKIKGGAKNTNCKSCPNTNCDGANCVPQCGCNQG